MAPVSDTAIIDDGGTAGVQGLTGSSAPVPAGATVATDMVSKNSVEVEELGKAAGAGATKLPAPAAAEAAAAAAEGSSGSVSAIPQKVEMTDGSQAPGPSAAAAAASTVAAGGGASTTNHGTATTTDPYYASHAIMNPNYGGNFGVDLDTLVKINGAGSPAAITEFVGGVPALCAKLRVDGEKGLDEKNEEDLKQRREAFGSNTYPSRPTKSFLAFVWDAMHDLTLIVLMICAALAFTSGMITEGPEHGWHDGLAICIAFSIVILVTALTNYKQALQFKGLNAEKSNIQLKVLRNGHIKTMSIFDLVVGDVVSLAIGDQVPADGIFLSGHSLTCDESSMTGESDPLHKDATRPFLLSGCKVIDGYGTMLVTAVGMNTEWGRVMATLNEEVEGETPLQMRLNRLAKTIAMIGVTVACLVLIIIITRYAITTEDADSNTIFKDVVETFSIVVTIIVVAIPEGLPLAVTLSLGYSMRQMMRDKALVRHLSACETMGSATTICSDKTGTLTLNEMTVVKEWSAGEMRRVASRSDVDEEVWKLLREGIAQNCSGSVGYDSYGEPEVTASPTESALLHWGIKLGMDWHAERAASEIVAVESFNSTKKRAGVVVKRPDGKLIAHWKGAAEMVLANCTLFIDSKGEGQPLTEEKKEEMAHVIEEMASSSLRCIAFGMRQLQPAEVPANTDDWEIPEAKLKLITLVGIKDPCRPGVPEAVATCQRAGVKVRMVTGDNVLTARAIAGECGILTPNGIVIEGKDFRVLSTEQMMKLLPRIDVMARSSPTDKHLMVKTLRAMGEVVAVTGDGTNDAPALKEADIGLSMGITGTEVAKEASDIVILDDNFTTIVKVMRWGRSVFANIQKFLQFQLTVNVVALTMNFVAACSNGEVPLTAVQLLWVNMIMNTMGALALATEPPSDEVLTNPPVGRTAPLISNIMWRNLLGQAAYQFSILMAIFYAGEEMFGLSYDEHGEDVKQTMVFNTFVWCQLFNEINARKPHKFNVFEGITRAHVFIAVWLISVIFQTIMIEFLQAFASTVALTTGQWFICVGLGSLAIPLAVVVKYIPVGETPWFDWVGKLLQKLKIKKGKGNVANVDNDPPTHDEVVAIKAIEENTNIGAQ